MIIPKNLPRFGKIALAEMEARIEYRASGKMTTRDERAWNDSKAKAEARHMAASVEALRRYMSGK